MIEQIAQKIATNFIINGIVQNENKELYAYGIKQLLDFILNILSAIIIGCFFSMIWQSLVFSVAYIFLRRYGGGYHAPNPSTCYVLSIILIVISMLIIKIMDINLWVVLISLLISMVLFFTKAPVESKNKPLDRIEKERYKKYARLVAVLEGSIAGLLFFMGLIEPCECILVALSISAILLLFPDKVHEKA